MSKSDYIGTNEFKMAMPIEKAFEKEVDGETRRYVAGLASGTTVDLDEERMAASAILAFQKAIMEGVTLPPNDVWSLIPLRSGHRKEWDDILGWVVKAEVDDQHQLWIEAELANTSAARDLYTVLTEPQRHGRPVQLGFSVGGKIKKASREWNQERKKSIRVLEEIALGEISVTGRPAYAPSYVEALTKSVDWDNVPLAQEEITKESIMKEEQVDQGATSNVVGTAPAQNTDAEVTNESQKAVEVSTTDPQNDANPQVNEVGQVPPVNDSSAVDANKAEVQTNVNADLVAQVEALKQQFEALTQAVGKSATTDKKTEVVVEKNVDEDRFVAALTAAFTAFKTETIDPLLADIQTVKSTVAEMSQQPVDKSLSVRTAKETETAVEKFKAEVASGKNVSPIGAAVRAAMGQ